MKFLYSMGMFEFNNHELARTIYRITVADNIIFKKMSKYIFCSSIIHLFGVTITDSESLVIPNKELSNNNSEKKSFCLESGDHGYNIQLSKYIIVTRYAGAIVATFPF